MVLCSAFDKVDPRFMDTTGRVYILKFDNVI